MHIMSIMNWINLTDILFLSIHAHEKHMILCEN